jgi:signal peptidase II
MQDQTAKYFLVSFLLIMIFFNKKMALIYTLAIFFVVLDRFLKALAFSGGFDRELIGDFFSFTFAANKYIAFSLPISGIFLMIFIGLILGFLLIQYITLIKQNEYIVSSAMAFLILGAFSNFYDRIRYGFVIDYLSLKYFSIFNIADAMIVLSAAFIIVYYLKYSSTNG